MSCTTVFNSKSIDIEELFLPNKNVNKVDVKKNEDKYIEMLHEINDWINVYKNIEGFNYRKEFNKFYGKMVNRYRIYCKKSI